MENKHKQKILKGRLREGLTGLLIRAGATSVGFDVSKCLADSVRRNNVESPAIIETLNEVIESVRGTNNFAEYNVIDDVQINEQIDRYNYLVSNPEAIEQFESYKANRNTDSLEIGVSLLGGLGMLGYGAIRYGKTK